MTRKLARKFSILSLFRVNRRLHRLTLLVPAFCSFSTSNPSDHELFLTFPSAMTDCGRSTCMPIFARLPTTQASNPGSNRISLHKFRPQTVLSLPTRPAQTATFEISSSVCAKPAVAGPPSLPPEQTLIP